MLVLGAPIPYLFADMAKYESVAQLSPSHVIIQIVNFINCIESFNHFH